MPQNNVGGEYFWKWGWFVLYVCLISPAFLQHLILANYVIGQLILIAFLEINMFRLVFCLFTKTL